MMTPAQQLLHSRPMTGIAVAIATFGLIVIIRQMGWLQGLELALYDTHIKLRPTIESTSSPVVIIKIDEADMSRWGHPLPDGVLADALDHLIALKPRTIGVDFFRDHTLQGRENLAALANKNPSIIFIERALGGPVPPPAFIKKPQQVGFADLKQDASGVIRRGLLMFWNEHKDVQISFALQLVLAYLKPEGIGLTVDPDNPEQSVLGKTTLTRFTQNTGGYQKADAGGYQYLIDYKGSANKFEVYRLSQLMTGDIPQQAIANKVVLIGMVASSITDLHHTPFSTGWGKTAEKYGVEIHAHLVDQLLRGVNINQPPIKTLTQWMEYFLILAAALIGAALAVIMEQKTLALVLVAVSALFLVVTQLMFNSSLWITAVPTLLSMIIALSITEAWLAQRERKAMGQMKSMFGKFVAPEVADHLWDQRDEFIANGKPKSQRLTATVMITDLQGFVSATQEMDPDDLMVWLNHYLDEMTQITMQHGGIVDDYAGDGIKINFGVPVPRTTQNEMNQDACAAVQCALAMGKKVKEINIESKASGLPEFKLRVGINTGTVIVGSLGSKDRMKYTTVGDVVNIAARLESFQKPSFKEQTNHHLRILTSLQTRERLDRSFHIVALGDQLIPSVPRKIPVFSILDKTELYSTDNGVQ